MTDPQSWVAPTCAGLAALLTATDPDTWDAPSLRETWRVRHVVAHVTMPVRLPPEQFGAELAAAGGDDDGRPRPAHRGPRRPLRRRPGRDPAQAGDTGWSWGDGQLVRADSGSLVALLSGRVLPEGPTLTRS